jgi:excisionase family DNA binding protein
MVVLDGDEYLGVEEAARALGVKPATLYAYVSRGLLRSYRQGIRRRRLYRRADIERLVRLAPTREDPHAPRPATRRHTPAIPPAETWIQD